MPEDYWKSLSDSLDWVSVPCRQVYGAGDVLLKTKVWYTIKLVGPLYSLLLSTYGYRLNYNATQG